MYTKENLVFNLIQNIFVGIAITISVTLMTTGFTTAGAFLVSFFKAYLINYAACLIIPIPWMAGAISRGLKIDPRGTGMRVLQTALCSVFYVAFILFFMLALEFGFTMQTLMIWKSMYPVLLIVGFVVGFIAGPVSMGAAMKLTGAGK